MCRRVCAAVQALKNIRGLQSIRRPPVGYKAQDLVVEVTKRFALLWGALPGTVKLDELNQYLREVYGQQVSEAGRIQVETELAVATSRHLSRGVQW